MSRNTKFWGGSSSSESESDSGSDSEVEQQTQKQAGGRFGAAFEDSDSGEFAEDSGCHRATNNTHEFVMISVL
jgi:hypothetical protein